MREGWTVKGDRAYWSAEGPRDAPTVFGTVADANDLVIELATMGDSSPARDNARVLRIRWELEKEDS